mgnify:CR=1 FL=1|jgi:hypothetical protein
MRSFTIQEVRDSTGKKLRYDGGRFISNTPSSAAKKAFSSYNKHKDNKRSLNINIKETTQGSSHKNYTYKVKKQKSNAERELPNGQIIKYKYVTKVKST